MAGGYVTRHGHIDTPIVVFADGDQLLVRGGSDGQASDTKSFSCPSLPPLIMIPTAADLDNFPRGTFPCLNSKVYGTKVCFISLHVCFWKEEEVD